MKKVKDNYEILLIMAIMEEQWNKLGNKFEQSDLGMPNQYINFMKQQVSSKNELLFVQSTRTMFSCLGSYITAYKELFIHYSTLLG